MNYTVSQSLKMKSAALVAYHVDFMMKKKQIKVKYIAHFKTHFI